MSGDRAGRAGDLTQPAEQAFLFIGMRFHEPGLVSLIAYVTMECEFEPGLSAVVVIIAYERDHLSVCHFFPPWIDFLHFMHISLIMGCSVRHFGQVIVSLWPQESQ